MEPHQPTHGYLAIMAMVLQAMHFIVHCNYSHAAF